MYYTTTEASEYLGCDRRTLNRYSREGKITPKKEGRKKLYLKEEIEGIAPIIKQRQEQNGANSKAISIKGSLSMLEEIGSKYVSECRDTMKEFKIYTPSDEILLSELGNQYELYVEYTNESRLEKDVNLAKLGDMYFKNTVTILKQLGLTPQARSSIKANAPEEKTKDIFDELKGLLS